MAEERRVPDSVVNNSRVDINLRRNQNVVRTLRRIRQVIADTVRSYQCSANIVYRPLYMAKAKLMRISTEVSQGKVTREYAEKSCMRRKLEYSAQKTERGFLLHKTPLMQKTSFK
ncbi:uncharacterized protein LOC112590140 isoform X2 [Harpegnathos saltator]|uniref:uncharacterized protein LOC112590140 isoform X2 n=1 Tax=Harpegnathos saltator TaxID=610380 RepID=UPI000DBEDF50|nr:uncharacterized protein LOC112590140 isoform X2 [Harpegnathos saltator]XP_025161705.1 uncharacterized protein LOC112590140 isoform X2 [Harpegnathos saltator]